LRCKIPISKNKKIEIISIIVFIPILSILAHLYGNWVWWVLFALAAIFFSVLYLIFHILEVRASNRIKIANDKIQKRWDERKRNRQNKIDNAIKQPDSLK